MQTFSRCGLIGFPPELVQSCATEEVARSLGIALAPCTIEEIVLFCIMHFAMGGVLCHQ